MNVACVKIYKISLVGILILLASLSACTSVNTFPMIARAGDTVSVMVGGTEKARKETMDVTLTAANGQVWDLKSLGLVRSVFNLRTDGRAYGNHYSSYTDSFISWAFGHEPLQTVLVADLPPNILPGNATLTVNPYVDDNSSGIGSPFSVNIEIIAGTGKSDNFLRRDVLSLSGSSPVDFLRLEPAPHAKISFGSGTFIGAASLVVSFNSNVINGNDINVYVPESTVRGSLGMFGKTQRMVYWRQDGQKLYMDLVAPQGIDPVYLKIYVIHPESTSNPNFSLISANVYGVDGAAIAVQPTMEYFP